MHETRVILVDPLGLEYGIRDLMREPEGPDTSSKVDSSYDEVALEASTAGRDERESPDNGRECPDYAETGVDVREDNRGEPEEGWEKAGDPRREPPAFGPQARQETHPDDGEAEGG